MGLAAALLVAPTGARVGAWLRPQVERRAADALGYGVTIGKIEVHAFPPSLVAHALTVGESGAPGGAPPPLWLRVQTLKVRPHWSSLLVGHWVLAELSAADVQLDAVVLDAGEGDAKPDLAGAQTSPAQIFAAWRPRLRLPVDLLQLRISVLGATIACPQGLLVAPQVELTGSQRGLAQRALHVQATGARWTERAPPAGAGVARAVAFDATLAAEIEGDFARPQRLRLDGLSLQATAYAASVLLHGEVPLAEARLPEALDLQLRASANGDALLAWGMPHLAGELEATAEVAGSLAAASVRLALEARGRGRAAAGAPVLRGRLAGALQGGRWQLDEVWLAPSATGPQADAAPPYLQGTGHIELAAPHSFEAALSLHRAPVADVIAAVGAPMPQLELALSGNVQVKGALGRRSGTATLQLQGHPFLLRSKAVRHKPSETILGMDAVGLRAQLSLAGDRLHCEDLELYRRGATVAGAGDLLWPAGKAAQVALRLWAGGLPLQSLGPIAGVPYAGVAAFAGTLQGALASPTVEASVQVDHLRVGQVGLGHSEGVLRFVAPRLQLLQFHGRRDNGTLVGDGAITFGARPCVRAEAALRDWDGAAALADFAAPAGLSDVLDARLWGQLALVGPLDRPEGSARLKLPQLNVGPLMLGDADLAVDFAHNGDRLSATLETHLRRGTLLLHAKLADGNRKPGSKAAAPLLWTLSALSDAVPLQQVWRVDEGPAPTGTLALRLELQGPPTALTGSLVADVAQLALGPAQLGSVHLVGRAHRGRADVQVHLLQGGAQLAAELALSSPWPLDLRAQFTALDAQMLWPLLQERARRALEGVTARLTGEAHAHLTLADPRGLTADLRLEGAELGLRGTLLRLRAPAVLHVGHGKLRLARASLQDSEAQIILSGAVPLQSHGMLDFRADVEGDLHGLRGFLPSANAAQGPLSLHVHLRGPLQRPEILGEFAVQGASMRFVNADGQLQTLAGVSCKALFSGRAVAVTLGKAQLGRGRLRFGGEMSLGNGTWDRPEGGLNLRLQLDRVPLAPMAGLRSIVSGNLALGGKWDAPTLHGELRLQALRYSARIDLNTLVPKRAAPPLKAPFSPFGRPVALRIKLRAPNDLILSSKVLEAELAADLLVCGTTERIGMLGSLTPLWARARYNGNLFNVTRATIDFTDEYRLSPTYSVQAHTRACQIEADVLVQGDVDGYTVQPNGRDERGSVDPQDVLACLNFGLRLSDFDGNRKNSAGFASAFSGSIDALWTVSGLDDKVRHLLPIRVDELRLTSGWSSLSQRTTARVLVGKELGGKAALRYSRSLEDNDQAFALEYKAQPHTTLQANWLSARGVPVGDFGLDLRLHWELR